MSSSMPLIQPVPTPVLVQRIRNKSPWHSLVRYEFLLVLVWLGAEIGRACALRNCHDEKTTGGEFSYSTLTTSSATNENENETKTTTTLDPAALRRKIHRYVLFGAMVAAFLYWLVVDVWQFDMFHSPRIIELQPAQTTDHRASITPINGAVTTPWNYGSNGSNGLPNPPLLQNMYRTATNNKSMRQTSRDKK